MVIISCQPSKIAQTNYQHPIAYAPEEYVCYQASIPLNIDGKLDEADWQKALPTNDFQDIKGNLKPKPKYQTYTKMLWDKDYFYFGAYLEEPHIWAKLTKRDAVIFYDNDFEIFIDPDGDSHYYYEFEMNAFNTVWDLILMRPYREDGNPKVLNHWTINGLKSAVNIQGTLNNPNDKDSCWTVEVAIPWKVLKEMMPKSLKPKEGIQWRVNFSRVHWHTDIVNEEYQKQKNDKGKNLPEEVWSPQGIINMHAPETWGYVQFSEYQVGTKQVAFVPNPEEKIKWALRQMYFQQRQYYRTYQKYTDQLKDFTIPNVDIPNYKFQPEIKLTFTDYEIRSINPKGDYYWYIREDGKLYKRSSNKSN
jgi:hypothetical protein